MEPIKIQVPMEMVISPSDEGGFICETFISGTDPKGKEWKQKLVQRHTSVKNAIGISIRSDHFQKTYDVVAKLVLGDEYDEIVNESNRDSNHEPETPVQKPAEQKPQPEAQKSFSPVDEQLENLEKRLLEMKHSKLREYTSSNDLPIPISNGVPVPVHVEKIMKLIRERAEKLED